VVVGGGLLGIEAARGLTERGMLVDIIEMGEYLMSRQLDAEPAAVLRRAVTRIGIGVHTSVRAVALDTLDGVVRAVRLDDSFRLEADLVVLACGVRPRVSLGRAAGLRVGDGILVDDRLEVLGHQHLYAIGDCAEHRGRAPGAVGVAWEQAAVLAKVLLGDPDAAYTGSRQVTRLRAVDLDVAAFGVQTRTSGDEVVEYVNPLRGIYRRLIVRDKHLVGGVLIGSLDGVGLLLQFYDQNTQVPDDIEALLGDIRPGAGPLRLPDDAVVCGRGLRRRRRPAHAGHHRLWGLRGCRRTPAGRGFERPERCARRVRRFVNQWFRNRIGAKPSGNGCETPPA
jgi:NAD(P)H-nitrite reductase large subunit